MRSGPALTIFPFDLGGGERTIEVITRIDTPTWKCPLPPMTVQFCTTCGENKSRLVAGIFVKFYIGNVGWPVTIRDNHCHRCVFFIVISYFLNSKIIQITEQSLAEPLVCD